MANLITRSYITSLETNMRVVAENAFDAVFGTLQYDKVASVLTDQAAEVKIIVDVNTTSIDWGVDEGQVKYQSFDELDITFNYQHSTAGLSLKRSELTDSDYGAAKAGRWSKRVAERAAYLPEEQIWGPQGVIQQNSVSKVDGLPLFHAAHPNNPRDASRGNYSNLHTGVPIDNSVTLDVAMKNLTTVVGRIGKIKAADGILPRRLRAKYLFANPMLEARCKQLTGAAYISATDVGPLVSNNGLTFVPVPEIVSDTTYFLGVEEIAGSELGACIWWDREAFTLNAIDMTDQQLSAANVLQWHGRGRAAAFAGLAYKLHKAGT